ncbi:MAG TPA: class I SAM-dependent methyltransferase [Burkholderiales bacterium]|nr:class I SAM-dependent methyltransferase [Burkholderiales bacterium]
MEDAAELQKRVQAYWNAKPCDSEFSSREKLSREFFLEVERERYRLQSHIAGIIDAIDWRGKRVLEIGTGVGTDARRIIGRGGRYTGINVDAGSTLATSVALTTFGLPGGARQMDATALQFPDASFDIVYTFGVLHHIPEVDGAVAQIRRVLKPGGELVAMLYNRTSINYAVEIKYARKLGARALAVPGVLPLAAALGLPAQKLGRHRELARRAGRMSEQEWLNRNTDGPDNPYSQVYDEGEAARLFVGFEVRQQEVHYFNPEHWGPLGRALPSATVTALGRRWGWHRVVYAAKRP